MANLVSVRLRVGVREPWQDLGRPCPQYLPCIHRCSRARAQALLFQYLPVLSWLPRYPLRDWLLGDLLAGLSVAIMQLPQGEPYLTRRLYPESWVGVICNPSRPRARSPVFSCTLI